LTTRQRTTSSDHGRPIEHLANYHQVKQPDRIDTLQIPQEIGASVREGFSDNPGEVQGEYPDLENSGGNNQSEVNRLGASVKGATTPSVLSRFIMKKNPEKQMTSEIHLTENELLPGMLDQSQPKKASAQDGDTNSFNSRKRTTAIQMQARMKLSLNGSIQDIIPLESTEKVKSDMGSADNNHSFAASALPHFGKPAAFP